MFRCHKKQTLFQRSLRSCKTLNHRFFAVESSTAAATSDSNVKISPTRQRVSMKTIKELMDLKKEYNSIDPSKTPLTASGDVEYVKFFINGEELYAPKGISILEACHLNNINIPSLCWHPDLSVAGNCRLCLIENEKGKLVPSCATLLEGNNNNNNNNNNDNDKAMSFKTDSELVDKSIKQQLEFLRGSHNTDCLTCLANGKCELQDLSWMYNVKDITMEHELYDKNGNKIYDKPFRNDLGLYQRLDTDHSNIHHISHNDSTKEAEKEKEKRRKTKMNPQCNELSHLLIEHNWKRPHFSPISDRAIVMEPDKCILCTRCIRACDELQGMDILGLKNRGANEQVTTFADLPIDQTTCIQCGQCTMHCPVGAIHANDQAHEVMALLRNHHKNDNKILVASTAPSVRVTIAEEFGCDPGSLSTMKMVDALRRIGFDYVFDTNFTADLTIIEEANEFISRVLANLSTNEKYKVKDGSTIPALPMFTSCCPGWVNMVEKVYPELIPNLSTCRSPQGMMGSLIKNYVSQKYPSWKVNNNNNNATNNNNSNENTNDEKLKQIISVSIMPCVAKKDEAWREQLNNENDYVLTTRELGHLFRLNKIRWNSLKEDKNDKDCLYDSILGESTGAAVVFGATGGVMEAALRTAYDTLMPNKLTLENIDFKDVRGLKGVKDATIKLDLSKETANELGLPTPIEVKVAVAHQGREIRDFLDSGKWKDYHFIECMACRGGCIGGGGQPKSLDPFVIEKRIKSIYDIDKSMTKRKSHENKEVQQLYDDFLEKPNSHVAHKYLHTHYNDRSSMVVGK